MTEPHPVFVDAKASTGGFMTRIGPVIPIGTRCEAISQNGSRKLCVVTDYEIHNNRLYHTVKYVLKSGALLDGGCIEASGRDGAPQLIPTPPTSIQHGQNAGVEDAY